MAKKLKTTAAEVTPAAASAPKRVAPAHDDGEEVLLHTRGPEAINRPRLPDFPPFFYAAHPKRWRAELQLGRILPQLSKIPVTKGANLVDKLGDTTELEKRLAREGWTLIAPDLVSLSPGGGASYLKRVQVAEGVAYLDRWERALKGSRTILGDGAGYRDFVVWLVDAGYIPHPPVHVMTDAADACRTRYARYARNADRDPEARRRAEMWQAAEAVWRREIEQAAADLEDEGDEVSLEDARPEPDAT